MEPIVVQALEPHHLSQIGTWFDTGAANTLLKVPQLSAFDFKELGNKLRGWVVLDDGKVIGVATVIVDEQRNGHLNFAVKPSEQRQGVGNALVEQVMADPGVKDMSRLFAVAETNNVAAQKTLEKNNFMRAGHTAEGYFQFERR